MWELIKANQIKSWLVFIAMGIFFILLGYIIGMAWFPPNGGLIGVTLALWLWFILSLISYFSGDAIILLASRAKEVNHDIHPQLFNVVEEMKIAANLPVMPKVYIIDEAAPNAFATGKNLNKCAIAVTAGLLTRLNRDELQGVIAHEMSHITNRDILYMTFAGVMLGSIAMLSQIFLRSLWYSSGSSRRFRAGGKGGGQAQVIILIIAVILAVLAPIIARIFYFTLSRKREYLADAGAVRLTRYPAGLAAALEKISQSPLKLDAANKITASMYIANPFQKKEMQAASIFSAHPPIKERIKILRNMMQGTNYRDYQNSFAAVKETNIAVIPPHALSEEKETIPLRNPTTVMPKEEGMRQKARDLGDLIRAVNHYAFLICQCGLKIKIPPNFKQEKIFCPRCKRQLEIPLSNLKTAAVMMGVNLAQEVTQQGEEGQVYKRKSAGWESFSCKCGGLLNISPAFMSPQMQCHACKRKIKIT